MISLLNLTYPELTAFVTDTMQEAPFRAQQIWEWLWHKRARSFDEITVLSKKSRDFLNENAAIVWPEIVTTQQSTDGTTKFLLRLQDGAMIETVLIPSVSKDGKERFTQCLSCQVGCAMQCTFCSTGGMGFTRNMTMQEILGQILIARDYLQDDLHIPRLRNLVFMGMGEPLLNLRELTRSLETLNHEKGLRFSPRRITVSTCGIKQGLETLNERKMAFLAVSLHAPTQELRERIMPKAARWPLSEMISTLQEYSLHNREWITFEYLLLKGVNDSPEHARQLVKLLSPLKAKLNLIVYNETPGSPYKAPDPEAVLNFEKVLWNKGITAVLRKSKGQDIDAACGQLKTRVLSS